MKRETRLMLVVLTATILVLVSSLAGNRMPGGPGAGAVYAQQRYADDAPPIPLPEECGGVNPAGEPDPACCLFGYLYDYDGQPAGDDSKHPRDAGGHDRAGLA